ncbi:MAG: DUF1295 domain-containing protein [Lachnospiraceae bacterium]|nr:DUF1295 domain-containing protein [Lachnospiraceae bacterium]
MFHPYMWVLLIVALVLCSVGFYRFVWFMSVGYGLAIGGLGVAILVFAFTQGQASIPVILATLLLLVYGARLSGYLLVRELKNASYRKTLDQAMKETTGSEKPVPIFVKVVMWLMMGVLYIMQTSPVFYRVANAAADKGAVAAWIGVCIMACGVCLEAVADKQKSASKKVRPDMVAMDGLYKMCRCPNYFGEIVFWTGVFISGITVLTGWQWLVAILGYVLIVYIMFNGAKRLEKRQSKNYGDKKEYREYADKTPILIPFLPIYHLIKEEKK